MGSNLGRWIRKGSWTLLDKGLFGLSNFVLNVLLARWLAPPDYGAFTLFYGLFWFVGSFHTALLIEPLLVFGPGHYKNRLPEYLGALLYAHAGLTLPASLLCVLVAAGIKRFSPDLVAPLIALAISGPFILLLWLMRQACYVRLEPELAAIAGALYTVLMFLGAFILNQYQWLSTAAAFYVMGISSLGVGLWLAMRLRLNLYAVKPHLMREVSMHHWQFGRWAAATQGLMIAPENIYALALTTWGGLEATAALNALRNLNMPIARINVSLSSLLVPKLVEVRTQPQFMQTVRIALVCFTIGPILSWLLLGLLNQPIVLWLYQGNYQENASLIWVLGIGPIFGGILVVLNSTLRSLELPQKVFQAFCLFTPVNLVLTLGLIFTNKMPGAVFGLVLASVLEAGTMATLFLQAYRSKSAP
jgi:O-antigen/teichoic acid export membrane protein